MLHVVKLPLLDLYTPAGDGNWGGGGEECGKEGWTKGIWEEGGGGGVCERGLGVSGPSSMWRISWSTVELSCHALLCWSGTE